MSTNAEKALNFASAAASLCIEEGNVLAPGCHGDESRGLVHMANPGNAHQTLSIEPTRFCAVPEYRDLLAEGEVLPTPAALLELLRAHPAYQGEAPGPELKGWYSVWPTVTVPMSEKATQLLPQEPGRVGLHDATDALAQTIIGDVLGSPVDERGTALRDAPGVYPKLGVALYPWNREMRVAVNLGVYLAAVEQRTKHPRPTVLAGSIGAIRELLRQSSFALRKPPRGKAFGRGKWVAFRVVKTRSGPWSGAA